MHKKITDTERLDWLNDHHEVALGLMTTRIVEKIAKEKGLMTTPFDLREIADIGITQDRIVDGAPSTTRTSNSAN